MSIWAGGDCGLYPVDSLPAGGMIVRAKQSSRLLLLFCLWKTYLNVSTIATSLILSKKLIFVINCSFCWYFVFYCSAR